MTEHHNRYDNGPRHGRDDAPADRSADGRPQRGRRRGAGRDHGRRGRMARGDVRTAILLLLEEEPMHGYQLMQAIAERTDGRWTPSPGAIYPALGQLEDEGLVSMTAESGRKVVALTEAGFGHVQAARDTWPDPFAASGPNRPGRELHGLFQQVHSAIRQVARTGTDTQIAAAAAILAEARRSLYLLLAEGPDAPQD